MLANIIVFIAATAVLIISLVLVFHPEYEDGLLGRFALCLICMAAFALGSNIIDADFAAQFNRPGIMLWMGICIFLCRHFYRFMRWRHCGEFDWRPARK